MANLYERQELSEADSLFHESITGGIFKGEIIRKTEVGSYQAVVPMITGSARITGFHQFLVDERDEMSEGFLLE